MDSYVQDGSRPAARRDTAPGYDVSEEAVTPMLNLGRHIVAVRRAVLEQDQVNSLTGPDTNTDLWEQAA